MVSPYLTNQVGPSVFYTISRLPLHIGTSCHLPEIFPNDPVSVPNLDLRPPDDFEKPIGRVFNAEVSEVIAVTGRRFARYASFTK